MRACTLTHMLNPTEPPGTCLHTHVAMTSEEPTSVDPKGDASGLGWSAPLPFYKGSGGWRNSVL